MSRSLTDDDGIDALWLQRMARADRTPRARRATETTVRVRTMTDEEIAQERHAALRRKP